MSKGYHLQDHPQKDATNGIYHCRAQCFNSALLFLIAWVELLRSKTGPILCRSAWFVYNVLCHFFFTSSKIGSSVSSLLLLCVFIYLSVRARVRVPKDGYCASPIPKGTRTPFFCLLECGSGNDRGSPHLLYLSTVQRDYNQS